MRQIRFPQHGLVTCNMLFEHWQTTLEVSKCIHANIRVLQDLLPTVVFPCLTLWGKFLRWLPQAALVVWSVPRNRPARLWTFKVIKRVHMNVRVLQDLLPTIILPCLTLRCEFPRWLPQTAFIVGRIFEVAPARFATLKVRKREHANVRILQNLFPAIVLPWFTLWCKFLWWFPKAAVVTRQRVLDGELQALDLLQKSLLNKIRRLWGLLRHHSACRRRWARTASSKYAFLVLPKNLHGRRCLGTRTAPSFSL